MPNMERYNKFVPKDFRYSYINAFIERIHCQMYILIDCNSSNSFIEVTFWVIRLFFFTCLFIDSEETVCTNIHLEF